MATFAERLKLLRKEKQITIEQLANDLGSAKSTISRYENGREPKADILQLIANYFNVSVDYLLGKTEIREPRSIFDGAGSISKIMNNANEVELNSKDKKDIEKQFNKTMEMLESQEGLMLSGNPVDEEDWELLKAAIQNGLEYAKKMNKQKYTPKKYRKDEK